MDLCGAAYHADWGRVGHGQGQPAEAAQHPAPAGPALLTPPRRPLPTPSRQVGRENLPDGILYASRETHYSIFKAARMYRMDAVKVRRHSGQGARERGALLGFCGAGARHPNCTLAEHAGCWQACRLQAVSSVP
jgi:hypothetical protein